MAEAKEPEVAPAEDEDGQEELLMPTALRDWEFNDLLANLAKEMTNEDFKEAKARFSGEEGLGRRLLSAIRTPQELFDSLRQRTFLDRNNLLFLQAMLYRLGRMDLYDMAIRYAVSVGDVIYFSQPPDEPANGYTFVKFHIEGTNFKKFKRPSLEAMRMTAARLMFVPPEYVIIAGVEPSSSLLITFMVPTRFIKYLQIALKNTVAVKELTDQGIDIVRLCDTTVNLHGVEDADIIETEDQAKLKTTYEQLQITKGKLEDQEIECLELKRKLDEKEKAQSHVDYEVKAFLIKLLSEVNSQQKIPRLSKQSAYAFFKHGLNLVKQQKYNEEIIETLLDAQACVLNERVRDIEDIRFQALLLTIEKLTANVFQLQIANARLQNKSAFDDKEFQKRESLLSAILRRGIGVTRTLEVHPVMLEILRTISGMLHAEEKKVLLSRYEWSEEEDLFKHIRRVENDLLVCLLAKEVGRTGMYVDLMEFILKKLTEVKREDLKIIFRYMAEGMPTSQPATPVDPEQPKSSKQQQTSNKQQSKTGKDHRAKTSAKTPPAPGRKTIDEQVALILKKVANMEDMMLDAQKSHKLSTFGADILQPDFFKHDPRGLFGRYGTTAPADLKSTDP